MVITQYGRLGLPALSHVVEGFRPAHVHAPILHQKTQEETAVALVPDHKHEIVIYTRAQVEFEAYSGIKIN